MNNPQAVNSSWIPAQWPAPPTLHAGTTTRHHGFSQAPYDQLNLGDHVGDDFAHVMQNRLRLKQLLNLPSEPVWLMQEHGNKILELDQNPIENNTADGVYTTRAGVICTILTADCLPVLITNDLGTEVAALHCGWKGLAAGILQKSLQLFSNPPENLLVWLGPAIGAKHFEIGTEVKLAFDSVNELQDDTFIPTRPDHWLVSLYRIAMPILKAQGISKIYGGQYCTYRDVDQFYSHRRDGQQGGNTGRMASLIWMQPPEAL